MTDPTLAAQIEAQIAKAICENVGGAIMLLPEQSKKAAKVITALPAIVTALRQAGGRIDEWTVEELRQSVRTTVDAPNCGHNTYARTIGISSAKLSEFLSGKRGAEPSIIEPMGFRWALVNSDLYPRLEERPDADGFTPVEKDDALRQAEAAPGVVEAAAHLIDPMPFKHHRALYEYCLHCGDTEADARKVADDTHKADCDRVLASATAVIALARQQVRREGMVLVPKEPTEAMLRAGAGVWLGGIVHGMDEAWMERMRQTWTPMITAAPATDVGEKS